MTPSCPDRLSTPRSPRCAHGPRGRHRRAARSRRDTAGGGDHAALAGLCCARRARRVLRPVGDRPRGRRAADPAGAAVRRSPRFPRGIRRRPDRCADRGRRVVRPPRPHRGGPALMLQSLSDASLLLGLPDPAPSAAALAALRPEAITTLAGSLRPVEAAMDEAAGTAWTAADTARRSWSAAAPADSIGRAAAGAAAAHAAVAQVRRAAACAAQVLAAAAADGAAAVARAESAAANWPPSAPLIALGGPVVGSSSDPIMVVLGRLDAELTAACARADDAAAMLLDRLVDDPRAGLDQLPAAPPSSSFDPTHGRTAAGVDAAGRATLSADLTSSDPHRRALAASVSAVLAAHQGRGEQAQLLVYDPDAFHGQGRVAIALGDLSTADNLAVLTPGIGNSPMAAAPQLDLAERLREQAGSTDPTAETAVVLWLGYDIPMSAGLDGNVGTHAAFADVYAALDSDNAETGGALLADDVRKFAAMAPPSALVTLVGHSMGSVVTSQASRQPI